ncbi:MAG: 5'-nucleotidase C-terminal domain-containing protein [Acidobacteria bacterium]|nr:5'-nucleotidase C-terminal domain-containing protein [Acidobacteriota bacterium]
MRWFLFLLLTLPLAAERATVTVLATTDTHGNLYPVDYYTNRPARRGLAKVATLIAAERATAPGALLIDCGDTIQGSPVESVYQTIVRTGRPPLGLSFQPELYPQDPMMLAMNHLRYDSMTVGNHEFNFGLKNLEHARAGARFPWISANIEGGARPFRGFLVKRVGPVKVAVIGVTTPAVPTWEKPENLGAYRFTDPRQAVEHALAELRRTEKPDLVIAAVHAGLERGPSRENVVRDVAAVPGIDAIIFGHTHREVAGERIGTVLAVQPRNWGRSLARLDFTLERRGGNWAVAAKTSRLIPVKDETAADPAILAIARPYHELAERYLDTPVARAPADLDGTLGRVEDSALVDAIHAVQLHYAHADVSFASLFNPRVHVARGPVSVRQIAALYLYDNELYAVEGTGRMVREALENAARYFRSCQGQGCGQAPLVNSRVMGYNYDTAQGVTYEIDLTRPEGQRVVHLEWKGQPLDPDQRLRIAVNNYRAAGSAGYGMFRGAPILWTSTEGIRELMVRYYTARKQLPGRADGNWRIVPAEALRTLESEARGSKGGL